MTPEELAELRRKRYNATAVSLRLLNPDLMVLRVRPDAPVPAHKPGQYCTLGLGFWERRTEGCQEENIPPADLTKVIRRAYSLSSSVLDASGHLLRAEDADWLEFYIVLVRENPDGRVPALTPRLFALSEGDRLQIGERVTGQYTLDPVKSGDTVVFLGTGTGEAPHNYMTWELLRRGHAGRIVNACCVRYARDLGYQAAHHALMARFPNYSYLPLTTREPDAGRKVYIQDLVASGELEAHLGAPLDPATAHVFLCGNPKMIGVPRVDRDTGEKSYQHPGGVIELLERRGFVADVAARKLKGNVHFEEYW